MKKLLYIFTFALLVVACDKYEDGFEVEPTAIELEEVNASVENTDVIPGLLERLLSDLKEGKIKPVKGISASKSNDYIYLRFFNDGANDYVLFTTDGIITDFCIGDSYASNVVDRYYDNINGDGSQLAVEVASSGAVPITLDGDFENLFKYDFATAYKLDSRFLIIGTGEVVDAVITF